MIAGTESDSARGSRTRRWLTFALWGVVGLSILYVVLRLWVLTPYRVPTASMEPTLLGDHPAKGIRGDTVLVLKTAYVFSNPRRWDVVAFQAPESDGEESEDPPSMVKRVVALPGETVEITNGGLLVDGRPVTPPKESLAGPYIPKGPFGRRMVSLASDEYFVLGDNSYLSRDSRQWGPLPREKIFGKVLAVLHPLPRAGWVH